MIVDWDAMLVTMCLPVFTLVGLAATAPVQDKSARQDVYEVQGHRGARGEVVESTLAAYAKNLIDGVVTMEVDTGLSKDGHLIVWHDQYLDETKCQDTSPMFEGDKMFPYVGKYIANLTLAQLKTLDCGSRRLAEFPLAITAPGIKLSTLPELLDFVECTGSSNQFNIETKINVISTNQTRTTEAFLDQLLPTLQDYSVVDRTTHQGFNWRALELSKERLPQLTTSALVTPGSLHQRREEPDATSGPSDWLAGLDIDSFDGDTEGDRIAQAAHSVGANRLSPAVSLSSDPEAPDPTFPGFEWFTTPEMVSKAHDLGMSIVAWPVNRLATFEALFDLGVESVITDYPDILSDWTKRQGASVPKGLNEHTVRKCFERHAEFVR